MLQTSQEWGCSCSPPPTLGRRAQSIPAWELGSCCPSLSDRDLEELAAGDGAFFPSYPLNNVCRASKDDTWLRLPKSQLLKCRELPTGLCRLAQRALYACSSHINKSSRLQFTLNYIKVTAEPAAPAEKQYLYTRLLLWGRAQPGLSLLTPFPAVPTAPPWPHWHSWTQSSVGGNPAPNPIRSSFTESGQWQPMCARPCCAGGGGHGENVTPQLRSDTVSSPQHRAEWQRLGKNEVKTPQNASKDRLEEPPTHVGTHHPHSPSFPISFSLIPLRSWKSPSPSEAV